MEDEEFGEGLSVTSSMMRQPLPASLDIDNLSGTSVQFVDNENQPAHHSESLELVDDGQPVPEFSDKFWAGDFRESSGSIPGVDLGGLKAIGVDRKVTSLRMWHQTSELATRW